MVYFILMGKNEISLKDVLEEIVKWIGSGDKKRVKIVPGDTSDFCNLTSELEKRGIEYYQSDNSYVPEGEYEVNLSSIKLRL